MIENFFLKKSPIDYYFLGKECAFKERMLDGN